MKRSESSRGGSNQQANSKSHPPIMQGISPHDILVEKGSVDAIREREVITSLLDFFGM